MVADSLFLSDLVQNSSSLLPVTSCVYTLPHRNADTKKGVPCMKHLEKFLEIGQTQPYPSLPCCKALGKSLNTFLGLSFLVYKVMIITITTYLWDIYEIKEPNKPEHT